MTNIPQKNRPVPGKALPRFRVYEWTTLVAVSNNREEAHELRVRFTNKGYVTEAISNTI